MAEMTRDSTVFVAGGRGLVGSAILRRLERWGATRVLAPTSAELDLTDQAATFRFLEENQPGYVFVAAAKVGGIWANSNYPADFCYRNLVIETNVIHGSHLAGVRKLLLLGSSCIYPKDSALPIRESSLLTGPLEPTNEAYALAKIVGVKLCDYYRQQYGCDFISAMPTNTFGPNDNFDLKSGHMLASLLHKFHLAKVRSERSVVVWGTGKPRREMLYVDDLADACLLLMERYSQPGPINVGSGEDFSIREIAELLRKKIGFAGELEWDSSKPDGVFRKVLDVSRIQALGWKAEVSLEAGIERSYDWFVKNYPKIRVS